MTIVEILKYTYFSLLAVGSSGLFERDYLFIPRAFQVLSVDEERLGS